MVLQARNPTKNMAKYFYLSKACAVFFALFMSFAALSGAFAEDGVFEPLSITTASGKHDFQVEVMRTDEYFLIGRGVKR